MSYEEALRRIKKVKEVNSTALHLEKLGLKEIPSAVGELTQLLTLWLDSNQIIEIKGLEKLINLKTIWLDNNQITEIKGLEKLKNLTQISLCNNNITHLDLKSVNLGLEIKWEEDITYSSIDKCIFIKGNPLINPPLEIIQQGNDAIRRYLEKLEKEEQEIENVKRGLRLVEHKINLKKKEYEEKNTTEEKRKISEEILMFFNEFDELDKKLKKLEKSSYHFEAKLLIIGESGAGKTTLAKKIKEGIATEMPSEDETTRGINVSIFLFLFHTSQSGGKEMFKVNIWDFGGQEIYHATHQFFLSQRALYVLVTDGRKQNTHLNYWCQVVELLGENSPMLIVENQKQGHTLTALNFDGYKERFGFICTPMLRSNFLTTEGLPQVIEEIKHRIQNLPGIGTVLPRSWFNIRARIEEEAQKKDYISEDEYVKICETEGLNDIDALHLSKDYLHPVGVLLHFQDNPILRNYVILNNAWATDAVYAVLRSDKIVKETQGHFTYQDAEAIWGDAKYRRRVDFLLELMKKFELCYELENTKRYIAPQLLPSSPPAYTLRDGKKVRIIYEYDFLPKGLLNRLTVRLHEHIANQKWVWQQGVVLQLDNNQAEVIESYDNKKIEINAVGEEPKEILTEIVRELDKLNRTFEKIRVDKKVPCNCPTCSRSQTSYFFSYDSLIRRHRKNKPTIECDISYQDVKVLDLLFGILNEVPEINSKKIFISYSKEDEDLRKELDKQLTSLKRQQKVETWHDRDLYAGDEWHPTIIEKLESADIILLLVSANFMATDYIMNEEVPRALERAANKKCVLIPILIKPCVWENLPFAKYLALPDKGKAVTQYSDRDEAWTLVAKGIDVIVKL